LLIDRSHGRHLSGARTCGCRSAAYAPDRYRPLAHREAGSIIASDQNINHGEAG
jgi:hypothetical protein